MSVPEGRKSEALCAAGYQLPPRPVAGEPSSGGDPGRHGKFRRQPVSNTNSLRKEIARVQKDQEMGGEEGGSGTEQQAQSEGCEPVRELRGEGRAGKVEGHFLVGVVAGGLKPLLQTSPALPALRAGLECVVPDLLTQVIWGGEVIRERDTGRVCWAEARPCGDREWAPDSPCPFPSEPHASSSHKDPASPLTPTPVPVVEPVGFTGAG